MKLLIVHSSENSSWGSCKVISPNLQETYKLLANKFELNWFQIPIKYLSDEIDRSCSHIKDLVEKLKNDRPDRIIFIDHLPNPAEILNNLSLLIDLNQMPEVLIHVYGDFTYFSKDWLDLAPKLINHKVKFLTASASQKKILSFLCENSDVVEQFCFPVSSADFFYDSTARRKLREEYQIADQDIVILYSGRISLQKNVDILIKEYLKLNKSFNHKIHLWLVGAFDDMGAPFMGAETEEGYLYSKIDRMLSGLPEKFINRIKFWGLQDKHSLRDIKSAADMFISLSLYHDEDYGMSPAEALACGLPTLLTDWGGYSSFASKTWRCQLVPVSITEFGLKIKTSAILEFFKTYLDSYITDKDRKRWSDEFLGQFSIEKNSERLETIIKDKFNSFRGFNWAMSPLAQIYGKTSGNKSINAHASPSDKNFYYQIYKNYISAELAEDQNATYETVQWMYDYIRSSEIDYVSETRKKQKSYHQYLSPFSRKYYSTLNPALIFDAKINTQLFDRDLVLIRDGLVPLTLFFKEQTLTKFSGNIAIHKDLWFLVPPAWQSKTFFYDIKNENSFSKKQLPKKIFITGSLNSTFADPEDFKSDLEKLKESLGKDNLEKMEILAFLPVNKKEKLWGKWQDDELIKFANTLYENVNKEIKFANWQSIQAETNLKQTLYFEINRGYFIKDTFTRHFALSRGAGQLVSNSEILPGELIKSQKLSLYHSMNIYKPDFSQMPAYTNPFSNEYFDFFKNVYINNSKTPGILTSWDSWFASYLKKYYKLYPPKSL